MFITEKQKSMLEALKYGACLSVSEMVRDLGLSKNGQSAQNITYNFGRLIEKELVSIGREFANHQAIGYVITDAGRAALRADPVPIASTHYARISPMAQPNYVPPACGYVRNMGHRHIQSRGISA